MTNQWLLFLRKPHVKVAQGAVGIDRLLADFELLLGNQPPPVGLGGFFEKALEGGFQGAFVRDLVVAEALEGGEVFLEGLMSRFDARGFGHRH